MDNRALVDPLGRAEVLVYAHVIGELAGGNLADRGTVLGLLGRLPGALEATHAETRLFIDQNALIGRGIGYTDIHLLASAALTPDAQLWTHDRRLKQVAADLGLSYRASGR